MATNNVTLVQNWEQFDTRPKAASTAFSPNQFISYNGTGEVIPSVGGDTNAILGVGMELVSSSDSDYTSERKITYQVGRGFTFRIPVGTGTATANMIGQKFNLTDAGSLNVSANGQQIQITNFISATLVEGQIALLAN